jgi:YgiT-type zinc finger domain-containing protein
MYVAHIGGSHLWLPYKERDGRADQESMMKCAICHNGETTTGTTTVTLERDGKVVVIEGVPADVCTNCGEAYTDEAVTSKVLAEAALATGVEIQVKHYVAV